MSRGCPEDVQRMSRGCPEDVQRMSKGHPEGSKGSPEEGLGIYGNAYINMSRNHNDSDLRHCCVDGWYRRNHLNSGTMTVKNNNNISIAFFDERNTKDVWRISEGCQDDVYRMSRGFPKDVLRMSKEGHPEGSKGDLQRKDWGCIIMHTSAWAEITMIQT